MENSWRKPKLDIQGQKIFWDQQAPHYEKADMTVDNQGELICVLEKYKEVPCKELITLGGAIGCRDPKVILDDIISRNERPFPKVFMNDLSKKQLQWAQEKILKDYTRSGFHITYLPGEIRSVCTKIKNHMPRRLLIGIYESRSFFEAQPSSQYPLCGFDEYLRNHNILGQELLLNWMRYETGGIFTSCGIRTLVTSLDHPKDKLGIKKSLETFYRSVTDAGTENISCLQIIGRSHNHRGFFLSHWYTQTGFIPMLKEAFPATLFSITKYQFPKGALFVIDPLRHQPTGIITVLNNVMGNILPQNQLKTLHAIRRLIL
ncbi:MAG: hypothetical protein WC099_01390 [Candidatus Paceibacterota bacterium]